MVFWPYGFGLVARQGILVRRFVRTKLFSRCWSREGWKEGDRRKEKEGREGDRRESKKVGI